MAEFSPGLEGVVAAETAVSEVDGANGRLIYRGGYLIEDLVPVASYEEVAYLLWHGELPTEKELEALRRQMAAARKLNASARGTLAAMDSQTDPMDVLRTVVSAQGAAKALAKPTLNEAIALTALGCPMAADVMADVRDHLLTLPGIADAGVDIVYEPVWTPERMSEEARWELGMV